jgi:hypothetical protein
MQWARENHELAGLSDKAIIHLVEWNYGQYEGVTLKHIHEGARRAGRSSTSRRFRWVRMDRAGPVRPMATWRYSPWRCAARARGMLLPQH